MTIAIVSDLHCHGLKEYEARESLLVAGDVRIPANRHPGAALLQEIKEKHIAADVVLCPGDLANKVSQEGMSEAFRELRDISLKFGAQLVTTLGNHDVASRQKEGDPFGLAKRIHEDFPSADSERKRQFWSDGFFVATLSSSVQLVVLNTAHHHYSEPESKRGTFTNKNIVQLDHHLESIPSTQMRLALLHHHPILHSTGPHPSQDVIPTGDQLLEVLGRHGISLVIHGHRHQVRLSRHIAGGQEMVILAAGSFSALLQELGTVTRNVFHLLRIDGPGPPLKGLLKTWEFRYSDGWRPATTASAGIPHEVVIRDRPSVTFYDDLKRWMRRKRKTFIDQAEIAAQFPCIGSLFPDELERLYRELSTVPNTKVVKDEFGGLRGLGRVRRSYEEYD